MASMAFMVKAPDEGERARMAAEKENMMTLTDGDFDTRVLQASTPVLVDFWAVWCGPCIALAPTVEAVANEYRGRVSVGKLNVDENPNITMRYMVRGIPTIMLFKGGAIVDQIVGNVDKNTLKQMVDKHL